MRKTSPSLQTATLSFAWITLFFGAGGCSRSPLDSSTPGTGDLTSLILVSIDSLRADHCTPYGYQPPLAPSESTTPFLQRLATEGVVFENVSAPTSWTLPSHVSLLTGMHPVEHGVRNRYFRLAGDTEHVAGRLQKAGFQTAGFYSGPFLHADWGFDQGFDRYEGAVPYLQDPEITRVLANPDRGLVGLHDASHRDRQCSEHVIEAAIEWLDSCDPQRPFFLFLHLWDPHYDYEPPLDYAERFSPRAGARRTLRGFMESMDRWEGDELAEIVALYDAEIRYTDDQLARLFRHLETTRGTERCAFVVTSDHGDEFFEHDAKGHQKTLFEEVVHVPLVLWAPDHLPAGQRIPATVSLCDVAATGLELAGVDTWSQRSGRSLLPLLESPQQHREVLMDLWMPMGHRFFGWRQSQRKVLVNLRTQEQQVFHLGNDPGEQTPKPRGAAAAREAFQSIQGMPGFAERMNESDEMKARLEALGYVDR